MVYCPEVEGQRTKTSQLSAALQQVKCLSTGCVWEQMAQQRNTHWRARLHDGDHFRPRRRTVFGDLSVADDVLFVGDQDDDGVVDFASLGAQVLEQRLCAAERVAVEHREDDDVRVDVARLQTLLREDRQRER